MYFCEAAVGQTDTVVALPESLWLFSGYRASMWGADRRAEERTPPGAPLSQGWTGADGLILQLPSSWVRCRGRMRGSSEAALSLSSRGLGRTETQLPSAVACSQAQLALVAFLSLNHYPTSLVSWDCLASRPLMFKSSYQRLPPRGTQPKTTYFSF